MNLQRFSLYAFLFALCFGLFAQSGPALAASERISRGQAMSALHAWTTGRIAVRQNNGVGAVQFDEKFADFVIFPFGSDGNRYCEEDYKLAGLSWYNTSQDNYRDAKAILDTVDHEIIIDGQLYETIRTPVRRSAKFSGADLAHGYTEAALLEPGDLSVGAHTLSVPVYLDGALWFTFPTITFYIDAAGTGACV